MSNSWKYFPIVPIKGSLGAYLDELVTSLEGTEVTNDPIDKGGYTRYGITAGTLLDTMQDHNPRATMQDAIHSLNNMSATEAMHFYGNVILLPLTGLGDTAMIIIGDTLINSGQSKATAIAQTAYNCCAGLVYEKLKVDSNYGPMTRGNIIKMTSDSSRRVAFFNTFLDLRELDYCDQVAHDPTQAKWLAGWMLRAKRFRWLANSVI